MSKKTPGAGYCNTMYLFAPVNALVEGIYEENTPFSEVKKYGDFGLGTFNSLDGEMVMLDGRVYQIDSGGRVREIDDEAMTPFSCVTFYQPFSHEELNDPLSYDGFLDWLASLLPSMNLCYALRVDGLFASMSVRSVPKQENYRPLVEVAGDQPVFRFSQIEGTLAGFYTPAFLGSLSVPGLHLHFLSAHRDHGGHLLGCEPRRVRVGIQVLNRVEVALPMTLDYLTWEFRRDTGRDLDKAER